ncbi:MAG: amidase [Legionella sp.]|nr:MAG: amidase [Legionella sp.]
MLVDEYIRYDVQALATLIKSGQVNAEEALNCALLRLEEVNSQLNAVVTECPQFAYDCLKQMQGNEPYYGVPLLVKDLGFDLQGICTSEGSSFFSQYTAPHNSDIISQLIGLGFVPFAKTNTPELGLSYVTESHFLGPCRNPYDLDRTSGGSSGGSAAAVAMGIAPVATASDGGGSIRIPAACCGLFGFKPTTGLMPTGPYVREQWSGMATSFVLARSVSDTKELFLHLMNKDFGKLGHRQKKKLHISNLEGPFAPVPIDAPCLAAVTQIEDVLKDAGHKVDKVYLELDQQGIGEATLTLIAANTFTAIELQEKNLRRKGELSELEPITWEFYHRGQTIKAYELINAQNRLYQLLQPLHELLKHRDLVLTPALAKLPLYIGSLSTQDEFNRYLQKNTEFSPFTSLFNQAGLPAMTIPVMMHGQLPISVQFGGGRGKDLFLLNLALSLQEYLPYFSPF